MLSYWLLVGATGNEKLVGYSTTGYCGNHMSGKAKINVQNVKGEKGYE